MSERCCAEWSAAAFSERGAVAVEFALNEVEESDMAGFSESCSRGDSSPALQNGPPVSDRLVERVDATVLNGSQRKTDVLRPDVHATVAVNESPNIAVVDLLKLAPGGEELTAHAHDFEGADEPLVALRDGFRMV
jgi:hypothetical protein